VWKALQARVATRATSNRDRLFPRLMIDFIKVTKDQIYLKSLVLKSFKELEGSVWLKRKIKQNLVLKRVLVAFRVIC
jgi:hypothetical protein